MAEEKFKPGDIVYHKATDQKGVVASEEAAEGYLMIAWEDSKKDYCTKVELETEEEHKKKNPPPNQKGGGSFMAA